MTAPTPLRRRELLLGTAALAAAPLAAIPKAARAQAAAWPNQPVKLMIAFPAGGPTDITMRVLAENAGKLLGQQVLIDNKPGAGGTLPATLLQQAKPDGYTLAQIPLGVFRLPYTTKITWDPVKDISYIIGITGYAFGTVVPSDSPFKTLADLLAWAKANPGKLSYGSTGVLTSPHLTMEDIAQRAGVSLNHIPYKGSADLMQSLLGGQLMAAADSTGFAPHVASGKLRVLVTWGEQRLAKFPDVPTLKEAGFPIVQASPYGIGGPKGMDAALVQRIHDAFKQAMEMPSHVEALGKYDQALMHMGPAQYARFADETYKRERVLVDKLRAREAELTDTRRAMQTAAEEREGLLRRPAGPSAGGDRAEIDDLAARALTGVVALAGLLWLATIAVDVMRRPDAAAQVPVRLAASLGMIGIAAAGWWLRGAGRPRLASALALLATQVAAAALAWTGGFGLHALGTAAAAIAITISGVLVSRRVAIAVALLDAALVFALYRAEAIGLLDGLAAARTVNLEARLLSHLLLVAIGLVTALLVARLFATTLGRTLAAEQRAQALLRIGHDWTWELDAQGHVTYISPSFAERTGRSIEEFMLAAQPGGPVVEDAADKALLMEELRARPPFRDRVVHYRCADGTVVIVRGTGEPVQDAQGRFIGWRGVSRNITAERLAEAQQQRTQAMLDRLVRMSPDAITVARMADGRILLANAGFLAFTGCTEHEVIGRDAVDLGLWRQSESVRLYRALKAGGIVRDMRTVVTVHAGASSPSREVLLTAASFDWDGEPVAVVTIRDVTELAEAQRQAEAANHAKSAFLATMSHEIRTPLNGVLGLAQLLQDPALDAARRADYVGHLVGAAAQLNGIVSDVLDLSKIEAGQLQLESIGFSLHELVRSCFDSHAALGRERGLAMTLELDPALPDRVIGDPVRVRQIAGNFMGNALKFTARGGIVLAASVAPSGRIRLAVEDSGIGVDPALRERLFSPFAQADTSTTRRFGGTGLGLSICRELALQMGGSVGCDSPIDEPPGAAGGAPGGSRFWAELPLSPETLSAPETAAPEAGGRPDGLHGLHGLTVLVAEDNEVNLLIVSALLERLGAQVLAAGDGVEAVELALAEAGRIDAVLMDLHMPRVDGLTATRRLRALPATAKLPIYALSAAVLDQERRDAIDAGMDGFIAKPVREEDLRRVLGAAMGRPQGEPVGAA